MAKKHPDHTDARDPSQGALPEQTPPPGVSYGGDPSGPASTTDPDQESALGGHVATRSGRKQDK